MFSCHIQNIAYWAKWWMSEYSVKLSGKNTSRRIFGSREMNCNIGKTCRYFTACEINQFHILAWYFSTLIQCVKCNSSNEFCFLKMVYQWHIFNNWKHGVFFSYRMPSENPEGASSWLPKMIYGLYHLCMLDIRYFFAVGQNQLTK